MTRKKLLSSDSREREFEFTEEDFQRVSTLIYEHAGISLKASKQDMVYSRLTRRLRANGVNSFKEYLARLEKKKLG